MDSKDKKIKSIQSEIRIGKITSFDKENLNGWAQFVKKPYKRELIVSIETTDKEILESLNVNERVRIQVINYNGRRHAKIIKKL